MFYRPLPSQQYLKDCFEYQPETGLLIWKHRPLSHFVSERACNITNTRCVGKVAGNFDKSTGRRSVSVGQGEQFFASRIIWKWVTGADPTNAIDHRDLNKTNDKWDNLREATKAQNEYNTPIRKNNKTGFKNVCLDSRSGKYRAYITKDYKQKQIGLFLTAEEAFNAVKQAYPKYHGDFANIGTIEC